MALISHFYVNTISEFSDFTTGVGSDSDSNMILIFRESESESYQISDNVNTISDIRAISESDIKPEHRPGGAAAAAAAVVVVGLPKFEQTLLWRPCGRDQTRSTKVVSTHPEVGRRSRVDLDIQVRI